MLSLEWLSCFEHVVQSRLTHMSFRYPFLGSSLDHISLKHRFPRKESNRIRVVYLKETIRILPVGVDSNLGLLFRSSQVDPTFGVTVCSEDIV